VVVGGKYFLPVPEYQFFSLYVSAIFYPALGFGSSARQCRVLTTSGICFLQKSGVSLSQLNDQVRST
jgi:hypothetical protein